MNAVTYQDSLRGLPDDVAGEFDRLTIGWERFGEIDIADLSQESALMTRTDRKYALTLEEALQLQALLPHAQVVTVEGRRTSQYRSQYFDTPRFDSYFEAATSRRHRFKVRTRTYLDSGGSYLEVKTKNGRGQTMKQRCPTSQDGQFELSVADCDFIATSLELSNVPQARGLVEKLRPVVETNYQRTTLLDPDGSRVTWDTALCCSDATTHVQYPQLVLIETKSAGRTTATDRLLWKSGHRPVSVSKFATGLSALHPELPTNKWHRVLNSRAALSNTAVK